MRKRLKGKSMYPSVLYRVRMKNKRRTSREGDRERGGVLYSGGRGCGMIVRNHLHVGPVVPSLVGGGGRDGDNLVPLLRRAVLFLF